MTHHDEHPRGPTAPRGWRPRPAYVIAAAFAIVMLVLWLWVIAAGPSNGIEPMPNPATRSAPAR